MDMVRMEMDANIQALINISRKRLCQCADPIARAYWMSLIEEIAKVEPEIAWAMVPEGIRCGGCPELFGNCKKGNNFINSLEDATEMMTRYDEYNKIKLLKK